MAAKGTDWWDSASGVTIITCGAQVRRVPSSRSDARRSPQLPLSGGRRRSCRSPVPCWRCSAGEWLTLRALRAGARTAPGGRSQPPWTSAIQTTATFAQGRPSWAWSAAGSGPAPFVVSMPGLVALLPGELRRPTRAPSPWPTHSKLLAASAIWPTMRSPADDICLAGPSPWGGRGNPMRDRARQDARGHGGRGRERTQRRLWARPGPNGRPQPGSDPRNPLLLHPV